MKSSGGGGGREREKKELGPRKGGRTEGGTENPYFPTWGLVLVMKKKEATKREGRGKLSEAAEKSFGPPAPSLPLSCWRPNRKRGEGESFLVPLSLSLSSSSRRSLRFRGPFEEEAYFERRKGRGGPPFVGSPSLSLSVLVQFGGKGKEGGRKEKSRIVLQEKGGRPLSFLLHSTRRRRRRRPRSYVRRQVPAQEKGERRKFHQTGSYFYCSLDTTQGRRTL